MQVEQFKITGMTCGGCTSKVTRALEGISGVKDVKVLLSTGGATVQYNELLTSPDRLKSAVTGAGYGVDGGAASHGQRSKGGCCA